MKKRRLLRNAGLVALSGVLVGGAALAFTACSGSSDYTLSVFIFCSSADVITNRAICDRWAEEYSAEHAEELGDNKITVNFVPMSDKDEYFKQLSNKFSSGQYEDIIYVAPSSVLSYAQSGHILDLTSYIEADDTLASQVNGIWTDSLEFYSVEGTSFDMVRSSSVQYQNGNFINPDTNKDVSIYGLPKDYSNFGLGYNRNYFTDTFKKAYTTLKPSTGAESNRSVSTRLYSQNKPQAGEFSHTGKNSVASQGTNANKKSIEYAVSYKDYTNPYTGETYDITEGQEAPFISVGVPVRYRPFNYYKYPNYGDALAAGDPVAVSVDFYTEGEGYVITMPGFPGEEFEISSDTANAYNASADYNAAKGYITLTWAEYSALNWACAYMLNSFAWDSKGGMKTIAGEGNAEANYSAWFQGEGGKFVGGGGAADYANFYGGEQYEQGTFGANGYVLPWLFSNDSAYIDSTYTKVLNEKQGDTTLATKGADGSYSWTFDASTATIDKYVGDAYEKVSKRNLDGSTRNAQVQYGVNSANFIETYAAFQEYCATWNAHDGQAGDVVNEASDKKFNGQNTFVDGYSFFYGVGTWDVAEYQEVDEDTLAVGVMPTAVSNRFSLYSQARDAYYGATSDGQALVTYHNTATAKGTGNDANNDFACADIYETTETKEGLKVYTQEEIIANQLLRQDKWGGRMDSVGYAVNAHVADSNQPAWKAAAAVSLVTALTVDEEAQRTLTYGGAQIPNVRSMCKDYLNVTGSFEDMITPENENWDAYYDLAREMAKAGMNGETKTVSEYLNGKQIGGEDVAYDTQYANTRLCDFTTAAVSSTRIAYSMRVLRMINYTQNDRDVIIRMQTGMNTARDQLLGTTGSTWITNIDATATSSAFLAYRNQAALTAEQIDALDAGKLVALHPYQYGSGKQATIMTPAVYCANQVLVSQQRLDEKK